MLAVHPEGTNLIRQSDDESHADFPAVSSFRTLSGRLKFTVRRHKFNKDSLSRAAGRETLSPADHHALVRSLRMVSPTTPHCWTKSYVLDFSPRVDFQTKIVTPEVVEMRIRLSVKENLGSQIGRFDRFVRAGGLSRTTARLSCPSASI